MAARRLVEVVLGNSIGRAGPVRDGFAKEDAHYLVDAQDAPIQIEVT
jgi:hypothetical protein